MGYEEGKKVFEKLFTGTNELNDLADYVVKEDSVPRDVFGNYQKESAYAKVFVKLPADAKKQFRNLVISKLNAINQASEVAKQKMVIEMATATHARKEEEKKKSVFLGGKDRPEFERHEI